MWDKKRHFFLAKIRALNLVKLCSAWKIYALQHLLVGQTIAVVCQAQLPPCSEMGARSKTHHIASKTQTWIAPIER